MVFKTNSQTYISNKDAPQRGVEIDLATVDYVSDGDSFIVYVDDITAGTAVKVDTAFGDTLTFTKVTAASRLGGGTGILCTKVYKTGTTVTKLFAFY